MAVVTPSVTVAALVADRVASPGPLPIRLHGGGHGLHRAITHAAIQKTGLALAGYDTYLHAGRVLVFGESEIRFLESLDAATRRDAVRRALAHDVPCVLVTGGLDWIWGVPSVCISLCRIAWVASNSPNLDLWRC